MLKGTHIAFGIATALVLTRPDTLNETTLAITGGAIGGWIVDIDQKKFRDSEKFVFDTIGSILFIIVLLIIDFFSKNGIFSFITNHFGIRTIISLFLFAGLFVWGFRSSHRTFTHSITAAVLFSATVFGFCEPLAKPLMFGYASHIFLDLFNEKGMPLFYPLKKKFCLGKVSAGDPLNTVLFWIFLALDVLLIGNGLIRSISANYLISEFIKLTSSVHFGRFQLLQLYLIGVNILSFIASLIIYHNGDFEFGSDYLFLSSNQFLSMIIYLLNLIGGCVGCIFALIVIPSFQKSSRYFLKFWSCSYSCIKIWLIIYLVVCNPYNVQQINNFNAFIERFFLLVVSIIYFPYFYIYILIVNLIGLYIMHKIGNTSPDEYSFSYKSVLIFGILGGTILPFFSVITHRRYKKYDFVLETFPLMFVSHIFFLWYFFAINSV